MIDALRNDTVSALGLAAVMKSLLSDVTLITLSVYLSVRHTHEWMTLFYAGQHCLLPSHLS
jgi:hypothetical protein